MLPADAARAVDEERLGNAIDAVVHGDAARGVGSIGKRELELRKELSRRVVLVLDVDPDEGHVLSLVPLPGAREDRRLLVARRIAPGSPEVDDDHPSAKRVERDRLALEGLQIERSGGLPDERRGYLARVRPEAIAEEQEHRQRREGNRPPEEASAHAGLRGSGGIAKAAPMVITNCPIVGSRRSPRVDRPREGCAEGHHASSNTRLTPVSAGRAG